MSRCVQDDPHIMQHFIYTMNDPIYRNDIMKYHLVHSHKTKTHQWMGTWVLSQKSDSLFFKETDPLFGKQKFTGKNLSFFLQSVQNKFEKYPVSMFTVCLVYDEYLVHYVSFIYLSSEKQLISFDPGVDIYPHGQKTIVPLLQAEFRDLGLINTKKSENRLGYCHNIRWKARGLQFTGVENHPDAFCQSWTIFFMIRFLYSDGGEDQYETIKQFVHDWCNIRPHRRAVMLTERFIIPSLLYFPKILKHLKQMTHYKDSAVLMHKIISPTQKCIT